ATLLPALDGVPVAIPADWLDAFVPRRSHRGIGQLRLDLGAQRRRLNAQTREKDEGGNTHRATLCCAARATGKRPLPPGWQRPLSIRTLIVWVSLRDGNRVAARRRHRRAAWDCSPANTSTPWKPRRAFTSTVQRTSATASFTSRGPQPLKAKRTKSGMR